MFTSVGILLRCVIYFQNRNLFIDEANVARNIFERNFCTLLKPLAYEQFTPPVFLWLTKLSTLIIGMNEYALRLFPLIASIAALLVVVKIVGKFVPKQFSWYAIALISSAYIFIQYATELKQYSTDFFFTSILIYLALSVPVKSTKQLLFWVFMGVLSIYSSMPSVFVLSSVGFYWLFKDFTSKDIISTTKHLLVCFLWLLTFSVYFFTILKNQIQSDYLQNYHADAFLYLPWNFRNIVHDARLLSGIVTQVGGATFIAVATNMLLLLTGLVYLLKKNFSQGLLLMSPFIVLFAAGVLHKYAMASRLVLFIQPIIFVLLSIGVYVWFHLKNPFFKVALILVLMLNIINHQQFKYFTKKFEIQEIHYALDYLANSTNLKSNQKILVHHGAVPAFIFYTQMKHNVPSYSMLNENALLMEWDSDYASKLQQFPGSFILMTNYFSNEKMAMENMLENDYKVCVDEPGCLLFSTYN